MIINSYITKKIYNIKQDIEYIVKLYINNWYINETQINVCMYHLLNKKWYPHSLSVGSYTCVCLSQIKNVSITFTNVEFTFWSRRNLFV